MKTAILFDLDGTLLDTAPDFFKALSFLRIEQGLPPLSENLKDALRLAVSNGINAMLSVGLAEIANPNTNPHPLFDRFLQLYQSHIALQTVYFPGIESLLQALEQSGIAWGIVTNKPTQQTHSLLKAMDLLKRAQVVVSGDTTPFAKPHPAPLQYAADLLQIAPQHCLYIGDAERDIIAGKAAGMTTIAALFGYIGDHEEAKQNWHADHYVNSAYDILPWITTRWLPKMTISQ